MGSATTQARVEVGAALEALAPTADLARVGRELFGSLSVIESSPALRMAAGDSSAAPEAKATLLTSVFGPTVSADTLTVLVAVGRARWSDASDVVAGIEDLAVRALAAGAASAVDQEILGFSAVVSSDPQLELALGSKLGSSQARAGIVERLLAGKASAATVEILTQLVAHPRGRRIGALLSGAARAVADEAGYELARVTVATPITAEQTERLEASLSDRYGRPVRVNVVVDEDLVGGVRVEIGDDVIDGSVSSRLDDLRRKLAG